MSGLTHNAFQLTLDDGWREVALGEAVDKVRQKYGFKALTLAGGAPARRHLDHQSPAQSFHPDSGGAAEAARELAATASAKVDPRLSEASLQSRPC